jgi:hypothetical protein
MLNLLSPAATTVILAGSEIVVNDLAGGGGLNPLC